MVCSNTPESRQGRLGLYFIAPNVTPREINPYGRRIDSVYHSALAFRRSMENRTTSSLLVDFTRNLPSGYLEIQGLSMSVHIFWRKAVQAGTMRRELPRPERRRTPSKPNGEDSPSPHGGSAACLLIRPLHAGLPVKQ